MKKPLALLVVSGLLIPTWVAAADKLENIKLLWKPTTTLSKLGGIDPNGIKVKIQLQPLADARDNAALIGENREKANAPKKVSTQENVPAFVTDKLKKVIADAGVSVVEGGGDVVLSGELQKFFVEETNEYSGELRIKFTAKNPSGKELWTGSILGHASNFGRSYNDNNYYETLSNSIVDATVVLFRDAGLRKALAQ
jgi:hypothetical protein